MLWWVVLPVTLYTLIGFFGVPLLIRKVGVPELNTRLNGVATLGDVETNPYTFRLRLSGLEVQDAAGTRLFAVDRFEGRFLLFDTLFQRGWHFEKAIVDRPRVALGIAKDGAINAVALIKQRGGTSGVTTMKKVPRVVVHRLAVNAAEGTFEDLRPSSPFRAKVSDLAFSINDLDTRPDKPNRHQLTAMLGGEQRLEWTGDVFVDPLSSSGVITITGLDVSALMPYLESRTTGRVRSGRLDATVRYEFLPLREQKSVRVIVESAALQDATVTMDDTTILSARTVRLTDVAAEPLSRTLRIAKIAVEEPVMRVSREPDGTLSLMKLLPRGAARAPDAGAAGTSAAPAEPRVDPRTIPYPVQQVAEATRQVLEGLFGTWDVALEQLEVNGAALDAKDLAIDRPASLALRGITLTAGPIATSKHYELPFKVSATNEAGGSATLAGTLWPLDRRGAVSVDANNFNLAPVAGYLPENLAPPLPPMIVAGAIATAKGDLAFDLSDPAAGYASWNGSASLADVRAVAVLGEAPIAGVRRLSLSGQAAAKLPELKVRAIDWNGDIDIVGVSLDVPVGSVRSASVGSMKAGGRASVSMAASPDAAPIIIFDGDVSAADAQLALKTEVGAALEGKASLSVAAVTGASLNTADRTLRIADLSAESPSLDATAVVLPPRTADRDAPRQDSGGSLPAQGFKNPVLEIAQRLGYTIAIDRASISGGAITLRDESTTPPASFEVSSIAAAASQIRTDATQPTEIDVSAAVQGTGSFAIKGQVQLFTELPTAEVEVKVAGVPAKPYDPMVGRYVGYFVESGRVNTTIPLSIREGKLSGTLDFSLDQFHLGDSSKSPDAPDVPIKLGLDLLRDGNDRVAGKIPLSGDITAPGFSITGLIWEAFFNLIFKAATAPFQILGSIFGAAEGQDLSMVRFEPGVATLAPDALGTIDVIAKAMMERPKIEMVAIGRANADADTPGLRTLILRERMLARVQQGTPYVHTLDERQFKAAVEAEWKERRRALVAEGKAPSIEGTLPPIDAMEKDLLEATEVPAERFAALARARAEAVVAVLVKDNGIPAERVKIADPAPDAILADAPKVEFGVE